MLKLPLLFSLLSLAVGTFASPNRAYWSYGAAGQARSASGSAPAPSSTAAFPQFNKTQWQKYHCLTLDKVETMIPPCATYCEEYTFRGENGGPGKDGCHADDIPCHCQNSQKVSDIIEPCIFPFINASSTCTQADLLVLQAFVTDSCQFFNATKYADYHGCSADVENQIEEDIAAGVVSGPAPDKYYWSGS